jgi:hypothetical protein
MRAACFATLGGTLKGFGRISIAAGENDPEGDRIHRNNARKTVSSKFPAASTREFYRGGLHFSVAWVRHLRVKGRIPL